MNYKQVKMLEKLNKEKWVKSYGSPIPDSSGIYVLIRKEGDFKYAYIGQAKHILTRLAQHLMGYQHIDLSLKSHKLYSAENPTGWRLQACHSCAESVLDICEKRWIKTYADMGYQLRNKTIGGQGEGKVGLDNTKPPKNYYDGLKQGEINAKRKLNKWFNGSLIATINGKETKIKQRYLEQFNEYLKGEDNEVDES